MPEDTGSTRVISDDELTGLTELLCQFEGASDPRSIKSREAEVQFNSLLDELVSGQGRCSFSIDHLSTIPQLRQKPVPRPCVEDHSALSLRVTQDGIWITNRPWTPPSRMSFSASLSPSIGNRPAIGGRIIPSSISPIASVAS